MSGPLVLNLLSMRSFISPSGSLPLSNMTLLRIITSSEWGSESLSLATSVTKSPLVTMMPPVLLPVMMLSSITTLSPDITKIPVPEGIPATSDPGIAKFGVLLLVMKLRRTMASYDDLIGRPGVIKTKIPPVLFLATLPSTNTWRLFSISMPATLSKT